MVLSPEQASFLINMGLVTLVAAGSASVKDMTEEEFEAEAKESAKAQESNSKVTTNAMGDFLASVDPSKLPQA